MKCAACGASKLRATQRAIVLTGPGKLRPGRVCRACASTGWLLVLGDADGGPSRVRKRAEQARERSALATELISHAMARAGARMISPEHERCSARTEQTRRRCTLIEGHTGPHHSMLGGSWESEP